MLKNFQKILLAVLFAFIILFGIDNETICAASRGELKVTFIDVGQGDCILLQSEGQSMLVDGGKKASGERVTSYLKEEGIKRLDYIVSTHDHEDHIGGLYQVLDEFPVGEIYRTQQRYTCDISVAVNKLIFDKQITQKYPLPGSTMKLGCATIQFLAPNSYSYTSYNNHSLVLRVVNGNNSFLLTGDAEFESEDEMIKKGYELKSDVLKVGHHSALTSSSDSFIKAVDPTLSVIQCDSKSAAGFPRTTTLRKLTDSNIYKTDETGNLTMISNGEKITVDKSAFSYAKSEIDSVNGAVTGTYLKESKLLCNPKVESDYDLEGISLLQLTEDEDYDLLVSEPLHLKFTVDTGISKLSKIEYMKVTPDDEFDVETAVWKKLTNGELDLEEDFIGSIYVKFTNQMGNELIRKTTGFTLDVTAPENCKVVSNINDLSLVDINEKNTYSRYCMTPATLKFSADYGLSEDGLVEYMLVGRGKAFRESAEWTEADSLTIQDDFIGRVYVRFTDDAGHVTIKKTQGFKWIQGAPINSAVKDTSNKVSLISFKSTSKKVVSVKKKTTLMFSADFGHGGKEAIRYQIVQKGKPYKANGPWKVGSQVTLTKGFRGKIVVKFVDKAGYSITKKTEIIQVK